MSTLTTYSKTSSFSHGLFSDITRHWHKIAAGADVNSAVIKSRWSRCSQVSGWFLSPWEELWKILPSFLLISFWFHQKAAILGWWAQWTGTRQPSYTRWFVHVWDLGWALLAVCGDPTFLQDSATGGTKLQHLESFQCSAFPHRNGYEGQYAWSRMWGFPTAPETPRGGSC